MCTARKLNLLNYDIRALAFGDKFMILGQLNVVALISYIYILHSKSRHRLFQYVLVFQIQELTTTMWLDLGEGLFCDHISSRAPEGRKREHT